MIDNGVNDRPDLVRDEGLGSSEYSGNENVLSPLDLSGDVGY